ncbi:MAG: hypothetical protein HYZ23_00345 [Chloroflexi bacterium]|nr:hypothetical protein [Chloroflexota bacterium]
MTRTIVFVCEHGAAKSILAAAYFNKFARERSLDIHAIARGTNPDDELAASTINGLMDDGLKAEEEKPILLSQKDVEGAQAIVSFCDLPNEYNDVASIETWADVPPVSADYEKSRDMIVERLRQFMDGWKEA